MITIDRFCHLRPGDRLKVIDDLKRTKDTFCMGSMLDLNGEIVTVESLPEIEEGLFHGLPRIRVKEDIGSWQWTPQCFEYIIEQSSPIDLEEFI